MTFLAAPMLTSTRLLSATASDFLSFTDIDIIAIGSANLNFTWENHISFTIFKELPAELRFQM